MEVTDQCLQIAFIRLGTAWELKIDHMCCMDYVILIRVVSNSAAVLTDGSIKSLFSGGCNSVLQVSYFTGGKLEVEFFLH